MTAPKIDVLEDLCRLYGCTIDHIVYGSEEVNVIVPNSDVLMSIWSLLHSNKVTFDGEGLKINDKKLLDNINMISYFNDHIKETSCLEYAQALLRGIKKMSKGMEKQTSSEE